jgi:phytoene dehydrogenase-like protein
MSSQKKTSPSWICPPRKVLSVASKILLEGYRRKLARYRYGPGVREVDWALAAGWYGAFKGQIREIAEVERAVADKRVPERPFVLLSQPSLFDSSRAPAGRHTVGAYCHVPHGSPVDMTAAIESQVEGERDLPRGRSRGPGHLRKVRTWILLELRLAALRSWVPRNREIKRSVCPADR